MPTSALAATELSVEEWSRSFSERGIERAYVVSTPQGLAASHPDVLAPIAGIIAGSPDFAGHEAVFIGRSDDFPTLFFAFVHSTRRGLAQGGLRFTRYDDAADLIRDGLRLSRGMTRKNALAGLWWGGGKGILAETASLRARPELVARGGSPERDRLLEAYGAFIASLDGIYYTAEDVGTTTRDMDAVHRRNRFVTCISPALGGSGNPSGLTARGVLRSLEAAWEHLTGSRNLAGVRVALQGVGNVGGQLAHFLAAAGATLTIADPYAPAVEAIAQAVPGTRVVEGDAIFDAEADVFAPCARGAQLNPRTIPRLKVRLVCGAANNMLDDPARDAKALADRGILFVPDYVSNRMGIVNCADEWRGRQLDADLDRAIDGVYHDTLHLLERAAKSGQSTSATAEAWADEKAQEPHPLFGHRGKSLIDRLVHSGWAGPQR